MHLRMLKGRYLRPPSLLKRPSYTPLQSRKVRWRRKGRAKVRAEVCGMELLGIVFFLPSDTSSAAENG